LGAESIAGGVALANIKSVKSPAFDPKDVPRQIGTQFYPEPFRGQFATRIRQALGNFAGLKNFGVNLTQLPPGVWSSIRHWHSHQDELIYIVEGEVTLVTDQGEQVLTAGMAAGFPAGTPNAHHLINRSAGTVTYLEIGDRSSGDDVTYPDADLKAVSGVLTHKDGTPY
jgi:uncharacterized cupin superfamily protein